MQAKSYSIPSFARQQIEDIYLILFTFSTAIQACFSPTHIFKPFHFGEKIVFGLDSVRLLAPPMWLSHRLLSIVDLLSDILCFSPHLFVVSQCALPWGGPRLNAIYDHLAQGGMMIAIGTETGMAVAGVHTGEAVTAETEGMEEGEAATVGVGVGQVTTVLADDVKYKRSRMSRTFLG